MRDELRLVTQRHTAIEKAIAPTDVPAADLLTVPVDANPEVLLPRLHERPVNARHRHRESLPSILYLAVTCQERHHLDAGTLGQAIWQVVGQRVPDLHPKCRRNLSLVY